MKKAILIDGNNILFRSYYATSYSGVIMKNSKGFPTNALYGLINMLNKIIVEEKPTHIMIALDKGKTFRHEQYTAYKAGRKEVPEELKVQFPVAKEVIEALGIKWVECEGYEADDIIGTFAKEIDRDPEFIGTIISSDKDLLQLISDDVDVKLLKSHDSIRMDKKVFFDTYQTEPIHMIDLKALMGDPSDNIPGVKGIGEKTAISLISKYSSIDNLYEHIDEIKGRTHDKLVDDKELCYMSLDIATIYKDVPIDVNLNHLEYSGIDYDKYISLLKELEFSSLLKKVNVPNNSNAVITKNDDVDIKIVNDLNSIKLTEPYSLYIEILGTNYHKDEVLGLGVYNSNNSFYIPFSILKENPDFFSDGISKTVYDYKEIIYIFNKYGLSIDNVTFDSSVAGYLLNYNITGDISTFATSLGCDINLYDIVYGAKAKLKKPDEDTIARECITKAKFLYDSKARLIEELEQEKATYLYEQIEFPLISVLADMEIVGINVDREYLENFGKELTREIAKKEKEIYDTAGCEFNILSTKQLGDVLFEKLGLYYPKRKKEGVRYAYSTSKEVLDKIIDSHPIIQMILDYRTLTKIYTQYIMGLLSEIEDGKIHTIFNQTLTRTGRLSSEAPNLQNIPIRIELGKLIRKAFVPSKDSYLLSSDYSQIELRIFAHMSGATNLIEAFKTGADIHAKTASDIFGIPMENVTKDMRRSAKAVNFGILYGISSFGLSEDLNVDMKSAKKFMEDYLNTYPGIREYRDTLINGAYRDGYVKTLMNRKRTIEELKSRNYMVRSGGERMALNTPVQGSAADILKKAMVEIFAELNKRKLKTKMLLQVHDELIFDVPKEELEEVKELVCDIMENTYKLSVPLKVDIEIGKDWYDAK